MNAESDVSFHSVTWRYWPHVGATFNAVGCLRRSCSNKYTDQYSPISMMLTLQRQAREREDTKASYQRCPWLSAYTRLRLRLESLCTYSKALRAIKLISSSPTFPASEAQLSQSVNDISSCCRSEQGKWSFKLDTVFQIGRRRNFAQVIRVRRAGHRHSEPSTPRSIAYCISLGGDCIVYLLLALDPHGVWITVGKIPYFETGFWDLRARLQHRILTDRHFERSSHSDFLGGWTA